MTTEQALADARDFDSKRQEISREAWNQGKPSLGRELLADLARNTHLPEVVERLAADNAELKAEVERLKVELLDEKEEAFYASAILHKSGDLAGWWDSVALSSNVRLGDELVEAGRFEKHPAGYGRRWFYRPVQERNDDEED